MRELDEITAKLFQHTAARRRLDAPCFTDNNGFIVSTHSRPKAAGTPKYYHDLKNPCFNTQPPEGGWKAVMMRKTKQAGFQHTAARRRLAKFMPQPMLLSLFQHTAARRRLAGLKQND